MRDELCLRDGPYGYGRYSYGLVQTRPAGYLYSYAYIVVAHIVIAHMVMADIVMAYIARLHLQILQPKGAPV